MLADDFWTLSGSGTSLTRVLGSRFSARAIQVSDQGQLEAALNEARKQFFDASHHCWASVVRGEHDLETRQSDAGEPKGSAGMPIMLEIRKQRIENCAVIVTRWFGGTKLGTGGLVRSYSECAALAIEAAPRRLCRTGVCVEVNAHYDLQSIVYLLAAKFFAPVETATTGDGTQLSVKLRRNQADDFIAGLREQSAGKLMGRIGTEWTS